MKPIKCVVVGDKFVGKSYLVVSYLTKSFPTWYDATPFEYYSTSVTVDGKSSNIKVCDTSGSEDYDHLRTMSYTNASVFLICFSVVIPKSLDSAHERWFNMLRQHSPKIPIILVGTQIDLRSDQETIDKLNSDHLKPISQRQGIEMAEKIGAVRYLECSAMTQENLDVVFSEIVRCYEKFGIVADAEKSDRASCKLS